MSTIPGARLLLVAWLTIATTVAFTAPARAALPSCAAQHWVGSWTASPSGVAMPIDANLDPMLIGSNQTVRDVVVAHLGGTVLRLHLTNRFGTAPLTFTRVTVAVDRADASAEPGTITPVRFSGQRSVTVRAGSDVVSDPLALTFRAFQPLLVSIYVAHHTTAATEHWTAMSTQYLTPIGAGDHTTDVNGAPFTQRTTSWIYLDGIDVKAPWNTGAVVAFGDSITDGYVAGDVAVLPQDQTVLNQNERYPDYLQRRLIAAGRRLSVLDAGITGNMLLRSFYMPFIGPSALSRARLDAVDQPGITTVIIQEGINDLGFPPFATAQQVESALGALVAEFHAADARVLLGTLLPASNAILDGDLLDPNSNAERQQINAWIRTQHIADGVVDFDAVLRDPADPAILLPAYGGPDHLHPNAAGYEAMANAINLSDLAIPRCIASSRRSSA